MPFRKIKNLVPTNGEVFYYPNLFSSSESNSLFHALLQNIAWKQEPIILFGKTILQPRLTAWYSNESKSYTYSGITMQANPWTPELEYMKQKIEAITHTNFTSALLNQYRNERDSVGWHQDNEKELDANPIIASLSFGVMREIQFRHRTNKNWRKIAIPLEPGSLLLMRGETQKYWQHQIPKLKKPTGTRINITFRVIM